MLNVTLDILYTITKIFNVMFQGIGAVAINNLMEDAATAEISRAQLWQWLKHKAVMNDGRTFTVDLYQQFADEELEKLGGRSKQRFGDAASLLSKLILSPAMEEFLTLPAYDVLIKDSAKL